MAWTAKDFEESNQKKWTAADFANGFAQPKIEPTPPPKPTITDGLKTTLGNVKAAVTNPTFWDKVSSVNDKIGNSVKSAQNWLGRNLQAGIGDYSNAFYKTLQSIGGDKVPVLNKLLDYGVKATEQYQSKGGTDIGSQVVRSIPGAAQNMILAAMSGGASVPGQIAKTGAPAIAQATKQMLKSPAFLNSAMQSYGSTYSEARDAGADRLTAIRAAALNAIPSSMIEVSGGLEQIPKQAGQSLLKTIGKSAIEEAGEEILQYPIENLAKKGTYAPETPLFSLDRQAVINPVQMGEAGLVGGLAGGLLGGAGRAFSDVSTRMQEPVNAAPRFQEYAEPKADFYADPYGNVTNDPNFRPFPQLPPGPEINIQQAQPIPRADFYSDPYGNLHTELRPLQLQLPPPSGIEFQPEAPVNERFSPNRITPANLAALNRRGINPNVVKQSDLLKNLNPPISRIEPDYSAAAGQIETPKRMFPGERVNPLDNIQHPGFTSPVDSNVRIGGTPFQTAQNSFRAFEDSGRINTRGEVKESNLSQFEGQKNHKQALREWAADLVKNSDKWKDKGFAGGWRYSVNTQERNILDIAGPEDGQRIIDEVFTPIHENEARGIRFLNKNVEWAESLNLQNKKHKLAGTLEVEGFKTNTLTEREAVQLVGEKKIRLEDLPATMDKQKIQRAVNEFRTRFDSLIDLANKVLVDNGYAPVKYRKDYFPHFESPTDPFVVAMKQLGFQVDNMELPTDIAGITHQFRPGKKWFGHFLQRTGNNTTYDALEGFERYIYGIKDVIYHTYDIQRLRAFETALRSKYAPDNIKNRIMQIEDDPELSPDEKQEAIRALFDIDRGHLGNYVTNIREYTDSLAGKKSLSDRNFEHMLGRRMYNTVTNLENQIARNMIGWNVGSWITNFIPIAQAGGGISTKNLLRATYDTVMNFYQDDGFINRSTFLTNRKGTQRLTETTLEKIASAGMKPMEFIDTIASQILTRGKYLDEIQRGASPKEAMRKADYYAAGAITDRSRGALPTAFNKKNPLSKLFTMFQVEVNNQYGFLFKDLPREAKEKGVAWLASAIMKFMIGSFLYNELYEKLTGRRPALDPIGTIKHAFETDTPIQTLVEDTLEQTPFIGGIAGGGRLPISNALPDVMGLVKGETTWGKEALKPLTYLASPLGGGGQLKKTLEGIGAYNQGASLTDKGQMRFPIEQTPMNRIRTSLFGQYSTPEAREYFDKNRRPLGEKQTEQVLRSENPQEAFERFIKQREIDKILQQIKDTAKDDTLSRTEKDKKILQLRAQIDELRTTAR
jgi:hypothetical protein